MKESYHFGEQSEVVACLYSASQCFQRRIFQAESHQLQRLLILKVALLLKNSQPVHVAVLHLKNKKKRQIL